MAFLWGPLMHKTEAQIYTWTAMSQYELVCVGNVVKKKKKSFSSTCPSKRSV